MGNKQSRRDFLSNVGMVVLGISHLTAGAGNLTAMDKDNRPNIVFIFTDDLGWTDLGCYGNTYYETPNIDKLQKEGMKFTNAYATPLCGPSRACLYTGQNVTTHGAWTNWAFVPTYNRKPELGFLQPACKRNFDPQTVTFTELLKDAGYKTAMFGKSHMVSRRQAEGFDLKVQKVLLNRQADYFKYGITSRPEVEPNEEGEYINDYFTDRVLDYIEDSKDERFFLLLSTHLPHTPVQGKPEIVKKYQEKDRGNSPHESAAYAAMVETIDTNTGRILKKLEDLNLRKNTLIIFASDNGGLLSPQATSNSPLNKGKGFLYEGGIRVPLIVAWDGVVEEGTVCDEIVHTIDFYPTMLDVGKAKQQPKHKLEGLSMLPLWNNSEASLARDAMFWHFPGYAMGSRGRRTPKARPQSTVRSGDFKLIENLEDNSLELYNLKEDISERNNLAGSNPKKAQELLKQLKKWREETGAPMITKKR